MKWHNPRHRQWERVGERTTGEDYDVLFVPCQLSSFAGVTQGHCHD